MDIEITLAAGCALVALALLAGWRGARPPNPMKGPRLIPWRFIMVLSSALAMIFLFQAARMAGFQPPRR